MASVIDQLHATRKVNLKLFPLSFVLKSCASNTSPPHFSVSCLAVCQNVLGTVSTCYSSIPFTSIFLQFNFACKTKFDWFIWLWPDFLYIVCCDLPWCHNAFDFCYVNNSCISLRHTKSNFSFRVIHQIISNIILQIEVYWNKKV
jgi:hypothetical protein